MCVCVCVDLYKGSYYCRLSNLLDINAPNICLLPIKKETQARQGARKVLVDTIGLQAKLILHHHGMVAHTSNFKIKKL